MNSFNTPSLIIGKRARKKSDKTSPVVNEKCSPNEIDALTLSCDNTLIEVLYDYNYILKNYSLEDILNNDELFYSFITSEVYSYGGVMGYHYFDEYLKNEDRCKDNITKMSLDSKKYDRKYLLNNYGLKEKNLGKSRVLKKHLKEHFKY